MPMPKTAYLSPESVERSGIAVEYVKRSRILQFFGWYDTMVGIEGKSIPLADFFRMTGITERDCRKAFEEMGAG